MTFGKSTGLALAFGLILFGVSCSSGSSSSGPNTIAAVVQDLGLDPDGTTTVVTFASTKGLSAATTASFETNGPQLPTSVTVVDDEVTIVWDARVSPTDQVRAVGLTGVATSFHGVSTSDASAPTFTITSATQNPGLGGDTLQVQFAGPRVVESTVEDISNWVLTESSTALDLSGSSFVFDSNTQTVAVTLGTNANLHASFTLTASGVLSVADVATAGGAVVGAATGDSAAPTLVSAEQNLTEDEFGRVIDFTFSEAMSPVFSIQSSHFGVNLPDVAVSVDQPSEDVLRVTFNGPIVPGVESVNLTGLVDLHGNAFPTTLQTISQPSPVANAFDGLPAAVSVANANNDRVVIVTTQAFDPESAEDPTLWTIDVGGSVIDLSTQTLTYDLTSKTLVAQFDFDMPNGTVVMVTGNGVLEVDGQTFSDTSTVNVVGDNAGPAVSDVVQNRNLDDSGKTLDVQMNEDVDETTAETLVNWTVSGAQNLLSATLLSGLDTVRLVFDAPVIPGDDSLTVSNVHDLAGNNMTPSFPLAIDSTDVARPSPSTAEASALEGTNNDTLVVVFNDDMIESEIEDASNWSVESPIGTGVSTSGTTIDYAPSTRTATLTFDNGTNLQNGDDFKVSFSGARDLGANVVTTAFVSGAVQSETNLPRVDTIYRSASALDTLVVRFSEPCAQLTDLYSSVSNADGTRYVLRTSGGAFKAYPNAATTLDSGLGVSIAFGQTVDPSDTLDVLGVVDLAGNPCFPALAVTTQAQDLTQPSLAGGASVVTSITGDANDVVTVTFDRPMSPWNLLDASHYTLTQGLNTVDLSNASFAFDGTDTVTITLTSGAGNDLQTGATYDLSIDHVRSAQGTLRSASDTDAGIVCTGDSTAPSVSVGNVRLDPQTSGALLIDVSEAVDATQAETPANYDYNGGNVATAATRIGPRTIRATFAVTPTAGNSLDLTVYDLAGNPATLTRTVTAADSSAPLVSSVAGVIRPGFGGDTVVVTFNEPVDAASALDPASYDVLSGATTISLVGAQFVYDGNANRVTITLPAGQELVAGGALTVTVDNVADHSGNAIATPVPVVGTTSGDSTPAAFSSAFVNLRHDPLGLSVDVLFSEDVPAAFVSNASNWTASNGSVQSVEVLARDHCRFTLSAALTTNGTLSTNALPDFAGNTSGSISVNPLE